MIGNVVLIVMGFLLGLAAVAAIFETRMRREDLVWERHMAAQLRELVTSCEKCDYEYSTQLGRYGCPNCLAEGLD